MNGLMIGLALLEGIIAIISASICCGPLCCPGGSSRVKLLKFHIVNYHRKDKRLSSETVQNYKNSAEL